MTDVQAGDPSELIGVEDASALLEVTPDRIEVMVEEGLLVASEGPEGMRFVRGEVIAARLIGG